MSKLMIFEMTDAVSVQERNDIFKRDRKAGIAEKTCVILNFFKCFVESHKVHVQARERRGRQEKAVAEASLLHQAYAPAKSILH